MSSFQTSLRGSVAAASCLPSSPEGYRPGGDVSSGPGYASFAGRQGPTTPLLAAGGAAASEEETASAPGTRRRHRPPGRGPGSGRLRTLRQTRRALRLHLSPPPRLADHVPRPAPRRRHPRRPGLGRTPEDPEPAVNRMAWEVLPSESAPSRQEESTRAAACRIRNPDNPASGFYGSPMVVDQAEVSPDSKPSANSGATQIHLPI